MNSVVNSPSYLWLLDLGASHNIISDLNNLSIHSEYDDIDEVHIADDSGLPITPTGKFKLHFPYRSFILDNILCVPSTRQNLIHVSKFTRSNSVSMEFFPSFYVVKDLATGAQLIKGPSHDDFYHLSPHAQAVQPNKVSASVGVYASFSRWHAHLGHPSKDTSSFVIRTFNLPVLNMSFILGNDFVSCQLRKCHQLHFRTSSFHALHPLKYVVWGPTSVVPVDGFKYFMLLVDLFTSYCWVFPLNAKSQVFSVFPQFHALVERQFGHSIQNLYSDHGGEFVALQPYILKHGISWLTTALHTPQQNDIVERQNRHVLTKHYYMHLHYPLVLVICSTNSSLSY